MTAATPSRGPKAANSRIDVSGAGLSTSVCTICPQTSWRRRRGPALPLFCTVPPWPSMTSGMLLCPSPPAGHTEHWLEL
eukprot:9483760-Pyramimonas_sp.AAC.1